MEKFFKVQKTRMKRMLLSSVIVVSLLITVVPVYANDTFIDWDEDTKMDAWEVLEITDWASIQESLILDKSPACVSADVSGYVRKYEDKIRKVMEYNDDIVIISNVQVELMLAMLQVMGGEHPSETDPYQIKNWFDSEINNITPEKSIEYVLNRLLDAHAAHPSEIAVSYNKNDDALRSVIQGVMYGAKYTHNNPEYSLENSNNYYENNKNLYENRGVKPMKNFADEVSKLFSTTAISGTGEFTHPCPGMTYQSSYFGEIREFEVGGHKGNDYAAPVGTPTYAADNGTVIIAGWSDSAGNWVVIDHGNGLVSKYMHHSRILVSQGQTVKKGQQIGEVGSTGQSTGPHLHFQVELNGVAVHPDNYL